MDRRDDSRTFSVAGSRTVAGADRARPSSICNCGSFVPQRVNVVSSNYGRLDNPTPNRWYDKTAFTLPPAGFQGNAGRNKIIGPPFKNLDFSAAKTFRITERFHLQYRAEFFNILNHPNFGFPDANISNVTAGVISSAYDGRDIQMGLRLEW